MSTGHTLAQEIKDRYDSLARTQHMALIENTGLRIRLHRSERGKRMAELSAVALMIVALIEGSFLVMR